jgi:hypothetical protein
MITYEVRLYGPESERTLPGWNGFAVVLYREGTTEGFIGGYRVVDALEWEVIEGAVDLKGIVLDDLKERGLVPT